jgi:segregation and condensation protein B
VEAIRGVSSGSVLQTLLSAGLIEKAGRADSVGRPILYRTTFEFLEQFGLESVDDLPSLKPPETKNEEDDDQDDDT